MLYFILLHFYDLHFINCKSEAILGLMKNKSHQDRKELRMPSRKPQRKPFITETTSKNSFQWCKAHKNWDPRAVEIGHNASPFNPNSEVYLQDSQTSSFSHDLGMLQFLRVWWPQLPSQRPNDERYNRYIEILDEKLNPFMAISQTETTVFQQGNAPCYTVKKVKEWFVRKVM